MTVKARLKGDGEFLVADSIDTTLPVVRDGLIAHYPLDGNLKKRLSGIPSTTKVLAGSYRTDIRPVYKYLESVCDVTYMADISTVTTAEALKYDLLLYDGERWGCPNAVIYKFKDCVDAGVSCMASGNDTNNGTVNSPFVVSKSGSTKGEHVIEFAQGGYAFTGELTSSSGSSIGVIGGINALKGGAIPEYYRADSNQIMGYSYTADNGAIFFFDQEGSYTISEVSKLMMLKCIEATNHITTGGTLTNDGVALENITTNLYVDGNYKSKLASNHAIRNGNFSFPENVLSPSGSQVVKIVPKSAFSYIGRDITVTSGHDYTASCWMYVSGDWDGVNVGMHNEQGFSNTAYYDLSKKGTWQKLKVSATTTTTKARILVYDRGGANRGYLYATDVQFEKNNYGSEFTEDSRNAASLISIPLLTEHQDFTVVGEFLPSTVGDGTYDHTLVSRTFISAKKKSSPTGSIIHRYYVFGNITASYLNFNGEFPTGNIHKNYNTTLSKMHYIMRKSNGVVSYKIYQDGKWNLEHSKSVGDVPIDTIQLGDSSIPWNGIHSNVSIYNRALTDDEADKMVKTPYSVSNELVVANGINTTKTEHRGAVYPFDSNSSDIAGGYESLEDSNTVYTDRGVYIGSATTNLVHADHIDLKSTTDVLNRATKTDLGNNRYRFVNDGTGHSVIRIRIPKTSIIDGETYACSVSFEENSAQLGMDFCDVSMTVVGSSGDERSGRLEGTSSKSSITASSGWLDVNLASGQSVILHSPQVEKRTFCTAYVNGTRENSSLRLPYDIIDCKQDFTIYGWWYPTNIGSGGWQSMPITRDTASSDNGNRILLMPTSTTSTVVSLRTWIASGGTAEKVLVTPNRIALNEWNFFCLRRNGDDLSLSLGNASNGFGNNTNSFGTSLNTDETNQSWKIGRYHTSNMSNSYHRDYAFIQDATTDAEVEAIFNRRMYANTDGLNIQKNIHSNASLT